ncbi:MAG: glutamate 5-kinase [Oscillospiraceae bacterium]|nr:glutamate 5-kinase [Oscillospiraceae bacterium]
MYNIDGKKRIVIKIGTSTLAHKTGRLNIRRMENLVRVISDLQNGGRQITLVSSGAIGLGMSKLGMQTRPTETQLKQACAAVGQCELMYIYDKCFGEYNLTVAQLLLTKYNIDSPRKQNVVNTFEQLLNRNVIPVVNENDTVAIDELELEFGENDTLAAHVALLCKADMLIILSDIDGFYDSNPKLNPDAKLIPMVNKIDEDVRKLAGDAVSGLGTGGMITKLNAAEMTMAEGIDTVILNGRNPKILYDLFDGKQVGTIFTTDK